MPNQSPTNAVYLRTAILGTAAGLRSQLPLALLAAAAGRGDFAQNATGPLRLLRTRAARFALGTAAVGELIADKTPYVPSRIDPAPFAGRLFFGGLTGTIFARGNGTSSPLGFVLGAAASAFGAIAGYRFRTTLPRETGLPDPIWAIAEDLLALSLASVAIRPPAPQSWGETRDRPLQSLPNEHAVVHPPGLGGPGGPNYATLAT